MFKRRQPCYLLIIQEELNMNIKQKLIQEIEHTPDIVIEEVLNFLLFTKSRYEEKISKNKLQSDINESSSESDRNSRPIWELFAETAKNIPEEVLDKLPTDGAAQHDHYLYGTPKHEE
jgi:hypothetical protein